MPSSSFAIGMKCDQPGQLRQVDRPVFGGHIALHGDPEPDGVAAALPHMQRQKSGHIQRLVGGRHRVSTGGVVYSATTSAVRVISEGIRQEVKPWGLRTAIISPGAV